LSLKLIDKQQIMSKEIDIQKVTDNDCYTLLSAKERLLKNFLTDHFDFKELKKFGFYNKDIKKTDYQKQAERICHFFGYETVYEYNFKTNYAHISYADGHRPKGEPFLTELKAWPES
jgi:hypothetical protein